MKQKKDGTYYLNRRKSKWTVIENGRNARRTFTLPFGGTITRAVKYFERAGNYVTCNIWCHGRQIDIFEDLPGESFE